MEIYHEAIKNSHFTCPLSEEAMLPMMFMPDAVRATVELMQAERNKLTVETSYNLAGMSFTPEESNALGIVSACSKVSTAAGICSMAAAL